MAKKTIKAQTEEKPQPEPVRAPSLSEKSKPQTFITMATEGQTVTSKVKTTRELYMEIVDVEQN